MLRYCLVRAGSFQSARFASYNAVVNNVNFDDCEECFGNKSTWELVRAIAVLQVCSSQTIARNSLQLLRWTQGLVGVGGLRFLLKPTFYEQFVGGETSEELRRCTRNLTRTGVRVMLAATMEEDIGEGGSEVVYERNCDRILEAIDIATTEEIHLPFIQLKLSGLLSADLLVKIGEFYEKSHEKLALVKTLTQGMNTNKIDEGAFISILNEKEVLSLEKALQRLKKIADTAKSKGVKVLVDAECSYLNGGLSLLTMAAVSLFNRDASVIWNTYQCYLKNARENLIEEMDLAKELGCYFGAKLVRGAYMLQERKRARELKISDPVCDTYADTCHNYDKILSFLLEKHSEMGPQCQFLVASHNEESIKFAVKRIEDLNLNKESGGVCFGQLYGMCDQVSNSLLRAGLPVYKSVPYGKIDEVLPYLSRRVIENTSVLQGAAKELALLKRELKRRALTSI